MSVAPSTHTAPDEDTLATAAKSNDPQWAADATQEIPGPPPLPSARKGGPPPLPQRASSAAQPAPEKPQQPQGQSQHDPRRKFERKDIQLDVSLYSDSNFYAGFTENLSAGGVFIATHNLLKIGETIDLTITMPNDKEVVAHGVVRWIREYNEASDAPPGMGIQFTSLEGEDLIKDFLSARAPLFYDDE